MRVLSVASAQGWLCGLLVICAAGCADPGWAAVIYQENFDGGSGSLAGSSPAVAVGGGAWAGSAAFKADGTITGGGGGVYLPLAIEVGYEYSLSVSFVRVSGTWVAAGFAGGSATSANRLSENDGRGWGLAQADKVQAFLGPNTASKTTLDTVSTTNVATTQVIVLDATSSEPANWTVTITQRVGDSVYQPFSNRLAGITAASDITAIGLSTSGATADYTNLTLSKVSAVPEPATITLALGGLAAGAVSGVRRLRRS